MDQATSHTGEEVVSKFNSLNTDIEYIDNGMTGLLQLVDTHLNKPVKDRLRDKWEEWMDQAEHSYTASGENYHSTISRDLGDDQVKRNTNMAGTPPHPPKKYLGVPGSEIFHIFPNKWGYLHICGYHYDPKA